MDYGGFLERKAQITGYHGFDPVWRCEKLFDFQHALVEWALLKGRAAIFADCGLGKTAMQLAWAENVSQYTNGRVLVLTPLAVGSQTVREGEKFGIECRQVRDGKLPSAKIIITNYEKLHLFNPSDFAGCVCDESSILKNFDGSTRASVTDFMRKLPYRLLCTATAAPNDYVELGTSSEALGELGYIDMLQRFFKGVDGTYAQGGGGRGGAARWNADRFGGKWRFRGHAERDFWRWVCSWARAVRMPSDMGFADHGFALPPLRMEEHIVKAAIPRDDVLFDLPAVTLQEQRSERRRTMRERCETAAALISNTQEPAVAWGYLNQECDLLHRMIDGSVQVSGGDADEDKEEKFRAFCDGDIRVLVTKPVIGAWGMNWQHCAHQTFFPSHSFEQFYQSVRRSWRFGQAKEVTVDIIASEGERGVMRSIQRKAAQSEQMFRQLVAMMNDGLRIDKRQYIGINMEAPSWLQQIR